MSAQEPSRLHVVLLLSVYSISMLQWLRSSAAFKLQCCASLVPCNGGYTENHKTAPPLFAALAHPCSRRSICVSVVYVLHWQDAIVAQALGLKSSGAVPLLWHVMREYAANNNTTLVRGILGWGRGGGIVQINLGRLVWADCFVLSAHSCCANTTRARECRQCVAHHRCACVE